MIHSWLFAHDTLALEAAERAFDLDKEWSKIDVWKLIGQVGEGHVIELEPALVDYKHSVVSDMMQLLQVVDSAFPPNEGNVSIRDIIDRLKATLKVKA